MHYQLTYILASETPLDKVEKIAADINKKITDAGGIIKKPMPIAEEQIVFENNKNDEWLKKIAETQNIRIFKRRLSYPIKNVSYGFYVAAIYELIEKNQSEVAKKIESEIKLMKEIARFINAKYNFDVFSKQTRQREKIDQGAEKTKQKEEAEEESIEKITKEKSYEKEGKKEILSEKKQKPGKKTEIEELDEKLEQILNA